MPGFGEEKVKDPRLRPSPCARPLAVGYRLKYCEHIWIDAGAPGAGAVGAASGSMVAIWAGLSVTTVPLLRVLDVACLERSGRNGAGDLRVFRRALSLIGSEEEELVLL